jgi:branched-chain amino acid transport system ATP-binding protein
MLSVNSLTASFGDLKILNDISFSVETGGTVGIIGPNGSGKTTLFNTISGFVKNSSGEILLNNLPIQHFTPDKRAKNGLCRVFQNPGIFKQLTLEQNIILVLTANWSLFKTLIPLVGSVKNKLIEQAHEYLKLVGLEEKSKDLAGSLSGGQMRLLEMARALASNADVYLLDEPTAGVSPKLKDQVSKAISKIISLKKAVLVIEHDMNFIRSFVDRIIVLEQGRIFMDNTPENVMKSEKLREIYFGSSV